jgi:hypothetical protein
MKNPEPEKHEQPKERPENQPENDKGIVQPLIDELLPRPRPANVEPAPPRGPVHPPRPAELDQDAGGGYNPDHTIPQP